MKGSKWTWLRKKYSRLGFKEAAVIAQQIDDVLVRLYGDGSTEEWRFADESYINAYFKASRLDFILHTKFCPGCMKSKNCEECLFGKEVGICKYNGSLFSKFRDAIGEGDDKYDEYDGDK